MRQTSEYCAVGHPDRTCDYIASYIMDRYLEQDPRARVALEVQLKDCFCTVSGEVTSTCQFSNAEIAKFCREAVKHIGYDDEYVAKWGEGNAISGDGLEVTVHLSRQSGDIAQGVNTDGWGDQGIFWGMAVNSPATGNLPKDYYLARKIAHELVSRDVGGLDVKTQVTIEDKVVTECVVAIPLLPSGNTLEVERIVRDIVGTKCKIIINGTGRFVKHGSIGDCGTTGRKLVVDFYGGNSRIGGGSPWGKDPTKADVTLNIYARMRALDYMREHRLETVYCLIACCIGRREIAVSFFDGENKLLESRIESDPATHIIDELGLTQPCYADRCATGLFGYES